MTKKKEIIKNKVVKAVSHAFKCSHCGCEFESVVDNSLDPTNCPNCGSSAVI